MNFRFLALVDFFMKQEQEQGHAAALKKKEKWIDSFRIMNASQKMKKSIRIEDKLQHLIHSCPWEK